MSPFRSPKLAALAILGLIPFTQSHSHALVPTKFFAMSYADSCEVNTSLYDTYTSVQFTGECSLGKAEGKGKAVWLLDGDPLMEYEGAFVEGYIEGKGKALVYDGSFTVEGEWKAGFPIGCTARPYPPIEPQEPTPDLDEFVIVDHEVEFDLAEIQSFIQYPTLARMQNAEGRVIATVLVTEKGEISQVIIIESTSAVFEMPTISAIFRSKAVVKPAMKDGKPVAMWMTIPIVFKIR